MDDIWQFWGFLVFNYLLSLFVYFAVCVISILAIIFCVKQFISDKKTWVSGELSNIMDLGGTALCILAFVIVFVGINYHSFDVVLDLPNVINNNYNVTVGVVVEGDTDTDEDSEFRQFTLKELSTDKEIELTVVVTTPIHKGDILKVKYLPNSKHGYIIQRYMDIESIE